MSRQRSRRPPSPMRAPSPRSACSTRHLETHGGMAWLDADGVLNVRTSTQVPFLTRRALRGHLRAARQGPGVLRTRRRRLRRQAGNVRRGHSGAGRAQDRAAGEVGTDPRGAVHRDLDAASDARHGQGRCRQATASSPRCSSTCCPTPAPMAIMRRPVLFHACGESLGVYNCAEQEGRRLGRLYQHGAGRRVSRLRPAANPVRRGSRDRRAWRRQLGISPYDFRRHNVVKPGDPHAVTRRHRITTMC